MIIIYHHFPSTYCKSFEPLVDAKVSAEGLDHHLVVVVLPLICLVSIFSSAKSISLQSHNFSLPPGSKSYQFTPFQLKSPVNASLFHLCVTFLKAVSCFPSITVHNSGSSMLCLGAGEGRDLYNIASPNYVFFPFPSTKSTASSCCTPLMLSKNLVLCLLAF